jgi:O-antigen/teichoic acid export membrane protein
MEIKIGKGAIYLLIANFVFYLSGYIIHFGLGRILEPELYGVYGIVVVLITVIGTALALGIQQAVTKFVSEDERLAERIKRSALKVQAVFSLLIFAVCFLFAEQIANFFHDSSLTPYIRIIAFVPLFTIPSSVFIGYLNGLREFGKQAKIISLRGITKVIIIFTLVFLGFSLTGAIAGFTFSSLIILIICIYYAGFKKPEGSFQSNRIIKFAIPLTVFSLITNLLVFIDLFAVKILSPVAIASIQTGYYTAASNIARIPYYLLNALYFVLFPLISKSTFNQDTEQTERYINKSLRYILMFLVPVVFLVSSTSKELISLLYSSKYLAGGPALSILVFGLGFFTLFMILTAIISGSGKPKVAMLVSIFIVMIDIALNIALIPRYQLVGAAFATVSAMLIGLVIAAGYVLVTFKTQVYIKSSSKIIFSGLIVYFISVAYPIAGFLLVFKYLALILIYFSLLVCLKEFNKQDFQFLWNSLS